MSSHCSQFSNNWYNQHLWRMIFQEYNVQFWNNYQHCFRQYFDSKWTLRNNKYYFILFTDKNLVLTNKRNCGHTSYLVVITINLSFIWTKPFFYEMRYSSSPSWFLQWKCNHYFSNSVSKYFFENLIFFFLKIKISPFYE